MDSKGLIKDPSLRIVPSKRLQDYLKKLEYTCQDEDMPDGILKSLSAPPENVQEDVTAVFIDYSLHSEDLKVLNKFKPEFSETNEVPKIYERPTSDSILKLTDLDWLYMHLQKNHKDAEDILYFHELFEGSEILLPDNEVLKRNPVLEERCKKLRNQQMSREYKAMTKGVDNVRSKLPEDTIAYQIKQINKQLIAVAQFVMSVLAGFLFGFLGIDLMVGPLDFGFRLLLGVMAALIIAIAEIYFLAKKLNEDLNMVEPQPLVGSTIKVTPDTQGKKEHQD